MGLLERIQRALTEQWPDRMAWLIDRNGQTHEAEIARAAVELVFWLFPFSKNAKSTCSHRFFPGSAHIADTQ